MSNTPVANLVAIHKALCDDTRLAILQLTAGHSEGVSFQYLYSELTAERSLAEVSVRYHIYMLRNVGLLIEKPSGRDRVYTLNRTNVASWALAVMSLALRFGAIDKVWLNTAGEPVTVSEEPG